MNRRSRILTLSFTVLVGMMVLANVVYPRWIKPLLTLDERIIDARLELDKMERLELRVDRARRIYRELATRAGSLDIRRIENAARTRVNQLLAHHQVDDAVVAPSRPIEDRKTGVHRMVLSISGAASLEAAMGFLRDLCEIPQVLRVGNVTLAPAGTNRENRRSERVTLRVPLEILALPQQKALGERLDESTFSPPEKLVRHQQRDYSPIWKRTPFIEFEPLPPLVANAGADVEVNRGTGVQLVGRASGGDERYQFEWSGDGPLSSREGATVTLADTSQVARYLFTLTVRDESGNQATDTVAVNLREPPPPPPVVNAPPPTPPGPKRFPDGGQRQLAMVLIRDSGESRISELMVNHVMTRERSFYSVGDEFDGGVLRAVHPRGAVVERQNDFFVYPIGALLNQDIRGEYASETPVFGEIIQRLRSENLQPKAGAPGSPGEVPTGEGGSAGPAGGLNGQSSEVPGPAQPDVPVRGEPSGQGETPPGQPGPREPEAERESGPSQQAIPVPTRPPPTGTAEQPNRPSGRTAIPDRASSKRPSAKGQRAPNDHDSRTASPSPSGTPSTSDAQPTEGGAVQQDASKTPEGSASTGPELDQSKLTPEDAKARPELTPEQQERLKRAQPKRWTTRPPPSKRRQPAPRK